MGSNLAQILLEITIQASILIVAIMIIRALFGKKMDKKLQYYLWIPVALRLTVPVFIESRFSIMNLINTGNIKSSENNLFSGYSNTGSVNPLVSGASSAASDSPAPLNILFIIWIAGILISFTFSLILNLRFRLRLRSDRRELDSLIAHQVCDNLQMTSLPRVFVSDRTSSPCAAGIIFQSVYIPSWALENDQDLKYILMHEFTHIKQHDNLFALFLSVCCHIYWFNPLVWIMAKSAQIDRELACDSLVTKDLSSREKTDYGMILISSLKRQSADYRMTHVSPLISRKKEIHERLRLIGGSITPSSSVSAIVLAVMALVFFIATTTALKGSEALVIFPDDQSDPTSVAKIEQYMLRDFEGIPEEQLSLHIKDSGAAENISKMITPQRYWVRTDPSVVENDASGIIYLKVRDTRISATGSMYALRLSDTGSVYVAPVSSSNKSNLRYFKMSYEDRDALFGYLDDLYHGLDHKNS